jgi:CBS domain-containing protein
MSTKMVRDYMSRPLLAIHIESDGEDADSLMRAHEVSSLIVHDRDGKPAGVVSRTDLLAVLDLPSMALGDLMTPRVESIDAGAPVTEAAGVMSARKIHRLFVRDGGELCGVFSTKEVLAAMLDSGLRAPIARFMSKPVIAVEAREPVSHAIGKLARAGVGAIAVLDEGAPVGMFTQYEALESRFLPRDATVEDAMTQAMLCLPADTPLFRAAGFTVATRTRRILAVEHRQVVGILSGLDFARALAIAPLDLVAAAASR